MRADEPITQNEPVKPNSPLSAVVRLDFLPKGLKFPSRGVGTNPRPGSTMDSTDRAGPNHYETLGLQSTATSDEIEQAFAREVSVFRPRPLGSFARVSIAYATLRDPSRRRAYDTSIGIAPAPSPGALWNGSHVDGSGHFIASAVDRLSQPPAQAAQTPPDQAELSAAPFIAASVRGQEVEARPAPEPHIVREQSLRRPETVRTGSAKNYGIEWKRPMTVIGGLVVAAGVVGAGAGIVSGNDADVELPARATTVKLPRAKPLPIAAAPVLEASVSETQPQYERPRHVTVARRRIRAAPVPKLHYLSEKELDELPPVEVRSRMSEGASGGTGHDVSGAPAVAAEMPLPNAVIARTIGRIGYACGHVATTSAVEGQTGVFKVTCTSGHSYRAAPVRGRYHFRRLG